MKHEQRPEDIKQGPDPDLDHGPKESIADRAESHRLLAAQRDDPDWDLRGESAPRRYGTGPGCIRAIATATALGTAGAAALRRRRRRKAARRAAEGR